MSRVEMKHSSERILPRVKHAHSSSPRKFKGVDDYVSHTSLRILQGDLKYRLSNQHQILRAITTVRDLGTEAARFSFQNQSFARFSKSIRSVTPNNPLPRPPQTGVLEKLTLTNASLSQSERVTRANKVQVAFMRETWIKAHGLTSQSDTHTYTTAAKSLFIALADSEESVSTATVIGHLLTTGLADNTSDVISAFAGLFDAKEVCGLQLDEQRFLSVFRTKKVVDHIIDRMRKAVEEGKMRETGVTRASTTETQFQIEWVFPTFSKLMSVLRLWWQEMNTKQTENIHIRKVSQLLVEKGIVGNKFEGKKLVLASGVLFEGAYVKQPLFLQVFYPAVLKATLLNLALGMNSGAFKNSWSPMGLRIADYERKQILTALKSKKANCLEKTAFYAYSDFVKTTARITPRAEQKSPRSVIDTSSIPSFTKDLTFDLVCSTTPLSTIETTAIEEPPRKSMSATNEGQKPRVSLSPWKNESESVAGKSDEESVGETRNKLNQKYFKSAERTPIPRDVQLQRENRLHEHYTQMVEYASEMDHVLATISPYN